MTAISQSWYLRLITSSRYAFVPTPATRTQEHARVCSTRQWWLPFGAGEWGWNLEKQNGKRKEEKQRQSCRRLPPPSVVTEQCDHKCCFWKSRRTRRTEFWQSQTQITVSPAPRSDKGNANCLGMCVCCCCFFFFLFLACDNSHFLFQSHGLGRCWVQLNRSTFSSRRNKVTKKKGKKAHKTPILKKKCVLFPPSLTYQNNTGVICISQWNKDAGAGRR